MRVRRWRKSRWRSAANCPEADRVSYVGGVFRSGRVLARFRAEFAGAVVPPQYGPAAGALIEAYRIAGVRPELANLPEFEK